MGHLDLIEELGRGSSATVYKAWDRRLARHVALKLLAAGDADAPTALSEARRLARVRHPTVVSVFGADYVEGRVGLWMELLEGRTLEQILTSDGPFSPREALGIGQDVCAGLAAIHAAGLVHRDVKAQNIVREQGGRIVLMDVGPGPDGSSSERTANGLVGTPLYMAPELFAGRAPTLRADLYSAGVLLFRLVTAKFPVEARTLADVRTAHERGELHDVRDLRPDVPPRIAAVIHRALAAAPEERFESAGQMARALAAASYDLYERPPERARRSSGSMATVIVLTAAAASAAVLLVEHGGNAIWNRFGPGVAPGAAQTSADPPDAPAVGMSAGQRTLVSGFEELAGARGEEGDWLAAARLYEQIRSVYRDSIGEYSPLNGLTIAKTAWARHQAGDLDGGRYLYEEALVKLEQLLGEVHPYRATTMGALARLHEQAGRRDEALRWLGRALEVRRAVLGLTLDDSEAGWLTAAMHQAPGRRGMLLDEDEDGIVSAIEAILGLDPTSADTDGDGTGDADEDDDSDGLSNCLEYCLNVDPTGIMAHYGTTNPRRLGFFRHYGFEAAPAEGSGATSAPPAWRMRTGQIGYYFQTLTTTQKRRALATGWRLTARGHARAGSAYALVDFAPFAPRWDINLLAGPDHTQRAHLTTSVVPLEGPEIPIEGAQGFPVLQLSYAPAERAARFYVNGRPYAERYRGTRQFQDDRGLVFGAGSRSPESADGEADFVLVMLEIR